MICSRSRCVTGVWGFESDKQVKRLIHCVTNTALIGCDKHWVTLVNNRKYILSIEKTFEKNTDTQEKLASIKHCFDTESSVENSYITKIV